MSDFTERQQQIIDESIKIIANRGIQNLTIKNISKEIGISEAAIYRHFFSKKDILMAILDSFEIVADSVLKNIDPAKSCLDQIEEFVLDRYYKFSQLPDLSRVMFAEEVFQNDEDLAEKVLSIMHKHKNKIVTCIINGQQKNEIQAGLPPKDLFRIIMGGMRLTVTQWFLSNYAFDLIEEGTSLWISTKKLIIK